jgi:RHS repeat-associated protein
LGFNARERSIEWLGARYYSSDYSRFLSTDPRAHDYTEWSPYNYVLANPIRLIDPDGKSPDCCPWQEFATGFADRAAQISFPAYGAFTASKALYFDSPEIASGYYQYAEKLISGQGTLTDYLALVDISGTARTINEIKHIAELYGDGKYEELGAYAYTTIAGVFAAGAEMQSMGSKSKPKPKNSSSPTSTIDNIELIPTNSSIGGKIRYKGGQVGEFLANKKGIGDRLEITDIIYYPEKAIGNEMKNAFGPRAMLNTISYLKDYAKSQGYKQLRIQYQRAKNSSSAKPGKYFDRTFDL